MIITNNINVANRMRPYTQFEVVIAGGVLRASDGGIVGEAAVDFIRQFKVDYAVIGTSAIDPGRLPAGLRLSARSRSRKTIMDNARHVILAADSHQVRTHGPRPGRPYLEQVVDLRDGPMSG
jgi:DeoR family glycerol-3-phosphate regulon repressor